MSEPHVDVDARAAVFEAERPKLLGLAYRLLGSLGDAEDVVQDAWLRWSRVDDATMRSIERPGAWLTTTVSRLGLDRLRARRRERVEYVGPWLPEPWVRPMPADDPERTAEVADSLTTAFLVLLERLSPEERLVLLLVDVFGEPFATAADLVGRTHDATRQLAVRARRKLTGAGEVQRTPPREQLAIASAFVGAVMSGDVQAVMSMLGADAVLMSDGGARRHAARRPVVGPDRIARFLVNVVRRLPEGASMQPVWVNGSPGVLVTSMNGEPLMVHVVDVEGDVVARQWSILNPDKLAALGHVIDLV
jgi:RNA polymerase sigma-70 factor (ECF subfamily)